jgi:hypothetical protein
MIIPLLKSLQFIIRVLKVFEFVKIKLKKGNILINKIKEI